MSQPPTTATPEAPVQTIIIAATDLQVGDVIVSTYGDPESGIAPGVVRNTVTRAPRKLGGTGLVGFGLTAEGREPWAGRLPIRQGVTVERAA